MESNISKSLIILIILFGFLALNGCSKKPAPNTNFNAADTGKTKTEVKKPTGPSDSTDIYGSGYFDYRDNIESYHMGYSIPRDSIYKVENLKAFAQLNLLISKDSLNPGPYLDRANHYQNIQKYREALADYDRYIQLVPNNYSAYQNRGTAHERLKQFEEAIYDYNKVIELKPLDTIAYFNKGVVYDALDNPWQAIREYDRTIMIDPRLAKAYYNRGASYERIQNYDKAIEDYEKAMKLNPKYWDELSKKIDYLNSLK